MQGIRTYVSDCHCDPYRALRCLKIAVKVHHTRILRPCCSLCQNHHHIRAFVARVQFAHISDIGKSLGCTEVAKKASCERHQRCDEAD